VIARRSITPEQIRRARELVNGHPLPGREAPLPRDYHGSLGEVIMCDYYGGEVVDTLDYDLRIWGRSVEIKTKIYRAAHTPQLDWEVGVLAVSDHQRCDVLGFLGLRDDFAEAWIYGFLPRKKFYEVADYCNKGERGINGFKAKAPYWRAAINSLRTFSQAKDE
jgi:hypothetical protein